AGFNMNQLQENFTADISYLDFKGYRYSNIDIDGSFINKIFKGQIDINDRNIDLDFNGSFNLNPKLPLFAFTASVRGANLHKLNLVKDTIQLDADFNTNFTGSNLDNIQGYVQINRVRMTNTETAFVVDSVYLT